MGWGCTIKDVDIRGVRKEDLEWKYEEAKEMLVYYEKEITALVASTPREIIDDSGERVNWLEFSRMELISIFEGYKDAQRDCVLFGKALDNMEDVSNF